jgi:hypothetical protein
MTAKLITVTLVLAVVLGSWFAYYFSDKEVIKRQLTELAFELDKDGEETPLQLAFKMRAVKEQLADSCQVVIPEREYDEPLERDIIISYLMYHRNLYESINVDFEDLHLDIPTKGEANVLNTVRLTLENKAENVEEFGQVEFGLIKIEGDWLLHRIVLSENLVE